MTSQSGVTVDVKLLYTDEAFIKMVKDKIRALYDCIWEKALPSTDAFIGVIKVCMGFFWNERNDNSSYGTLSGTVFDGEKTMDNEAAFRVIQGRIMPLLRPFVDVTLSNELRNIAAGILAELVRDMESWFREPVTRNVHLPVATVGPENGILAMQRLLLKL